MTIFLYITAGIISYYLAGSVAAAIHNKIADSYGKDISPMVGVLWPILLPVELMVWLGNKIKNTKTSSRIFKILKQPYLLTKKVLDMEFKIKPLKLLAKNPIPKATIHSESNSA
jgi:hypothetical protein